MRSDYPLALSAAWSAHQWDVQCLILDVCTIVNYSSPSQSLQLPSCLPYHIGARVACALSVLFLGTTIRPHHETAGTRLQARGNISLYIGRDVHIYIYTCTYMEYEYVYIYIYVYTRVQTYTSYF